MRFPSSPRSILAPLAVATLLGCSPTDSDGGPAGIDPSTVDSGAGSAICAVAHKGSRGLVLAGRILAPAGPVDGELLIVDGRIACVAAACSSSPGYAEATRITCSRGVISPALINAHEHLDFNTKAPIKHDGVRYHHRHGWRRGADGELKLSLPQPANDPRVIAAAELRHVLAGTTSIVSSGGSAGLLRNLAAYREPELLEGLPAERTTFFDTFPLGDDAGKKLATGCAYPEIRSAGSAFAARMYAPHIAEGIDAAAENELTCLTRPESNLVRAQTSIMQAIGIDGRGIDVIAKAGAKVIWSPRSNVDLYGNTAPIAALKRAGVTIALGTDWLASGSMNLLRELQCADSLNEKYFGKALTDRELFEVATVNGAIAAGFAEHIGSLKVGLVADVAVFAPEGAVDYRAVIAARSADVRLVLRGGAPLYGDAALVDALDGTCAPLDVCGNARRVCVDVPSADLGALTAAGIGVYPLYACGDTPLDEPTCIPWRDTYPNGTSATDGDGDGVPNGMDNCPSVFNPPRPMDESAQADVDGDGAGDACDPAPLNPAVK